MDNSIISTAMPPESESQAQENGSTPMSVRIEAFWNNLASRRVLANNTRGNDEIEHPAFSDGQLTAGLNITARRCFSLNQERVAKLDGREDRLQMPAFNEPSDNRNDQTHQDYANYHRAFDDHSYNQNHGIHSASASNHRDEDEADHEKFKVSAKYTENSFMLISEKFQELTLTLQTPEERAVGKTIRATKPQTFEKISNQSQNHQNTSEDDECDPDVDYILSSGCLPSEVFLSL